MRADAIETKKGNEQPLRCQSFTAIPTSSELEMIVRSYQREPFHGRAIPLSMPYVAIAIQTTFTTPEG